MPKNTSSQGSAQQHPKYKVVGPGSVDRFAQFTADDVRHVADELQAKPSAKRGDGGIRRQDNFTK